jgi:hypothetical protein
MFLESLYSINVDIKVNSYDEHTYTYKKTRSAMLKSKFFHAISCIQLCFFPMTSSVKYLFNTSTKNRNFMENTSV